MQNRSERCILFSSHRQKSQKVPPFCLGGQLIRVSMPLFCLGGQLTRVSMPLFCLGGQLIRVSMPLFWPWPSSFDFYKTS